MAKDNSMAWYNSLPKDKQQLLDLWEEHDLTWDGPAWDDKPLSVELNMSTNAGGDMYINLEEISADALEEYVNSFDVNEEVAIWWPDGVAGRGVPFDNQAEHVEDLELWLAELRDIIDASRGIEHELTHQQDLAVEKFKSSFKELERMGIAISYDQNKGFTFHSAA
jgi:hypothetical protein